MSTLLKSSFAVIAIATVGCTTAVADDHRYISADYNLSAEDDLAIRQVINRLNHALDAADYELYGSFFAEDGVFVSDFGDAVGPEAVAAALTQVSPFITNKRHVAANLVISGDETQAIVTSYLVVFEREAGLEFVGSAINFDTLERRDGVWKITRHDSTLDPATQRAISAQMAPAGEE